MTDRQLATGVIHSDSDLGPLETAINRALAALIARAHAAEFRMARIEAVCVVLSRAVHASHSEAFPNCRDPLCIETRAALAPEKSSGEDPDI